jgi:formylglycine-generating enzyme required for sulfatase activity/tRNA A-37 threonylcarbamoyl transferase component Bud32
MELKFRCGKCDRKLEATATMAGTLVPCPNCGGDVTIPQAVLVPGVTLAGFRIEKEIGRGAMGRVFLATQLSMDRQVALKVMPSPRVADSEYVERFFQEVRLAARLEHPNIVAAFGAGEDHGYYYFAMAYIDGESLDARVKRDGPLPEKEALAWCVSIAEALAHAWERSRILHRDVKPANIMVDATGRAMIMDMGIAKNLSDDSHLTATGVAVGTPHYMSPEQARGSQNIDFRADMYSLGATLFHLVAGRVPFLGTSAVEVVAKHLHDPVPSVRSLRPVVSKECEDIIVRMMAKDRAQRFSSWEACIRDLRAVAKGKTPDTTKAKVAKQASEHLANQRTAASARSPAEAARQVPRVMLALALGALAVAIVIGAVVVSRPRVEPRPALPERRLRPPPEIPPPAVEPAALPSATDGTLAGPAAPVAVPPPATPAQTPPAGERPAPEAAAAPLAAPDTAAGTPPPETPPPAVGGPAPVPAVKDPLTMALQQVAGELIGYRTAAAVALWERARALLPPTLSAAALAEITASLAFADGCERRILGSFRKNMGTPVTVRLKDRQCRVLVKSVVPPMVKTLELQEKGSIGGSFAFAELDTTEKQSRLGAPETADVALGRALVAIWDQRLDLALPELRRFDTPLLRALQDALDERAAAQLDQAADGDYARLLRTTLRGPPPAEASKLLQDMRQRLDTPKSRERFAGRLKAYEAAYKNTPSGAQRLLLLNRLLEYPFAGSPWTVPGAGVEFVWVEFMACWVGSYEVTNAQYRVFRKDHTSGAAEGVSLNDDNQPAVGVSFEDAEGFAAFLTKREREADRLPAGFRYRLPQAEEWTALASCADDRKFPWGDTWPPPAEWNYNGSEWPGLEPARIPDHTDLFPVTSPVAKSGRNSWGLYGVGGNAMEWSSGEGGTSPELRGNAYCGSGGSHPSPSGYTIKSAWPQRNPNYRSAATGFRLLLAGDPSPKPEALFATPPK